MSVIKCYYITDTASLSELVSWCDSGGVDINYLKPPVTLSQKQLMTHYHYFVYFMLSSNLCDGCEWLGGESCHFKYLKIGASSYIEVAITNHG